MMRAAWMADQIVSEHYRDLASFDLEEGDAGDFDFYIDDRLIYAARDTGRYPHVNGLKQAVAEAIEARGQRARRDGRGGAG